MTRVTVDPVAPDRAALERAAAIIRQGGLVAFPTDTLYGLAANPYDAEAIARLFAAKGRPAEGAIPLIAADEAQVERQLGSLTPLARSLAAHFWPGPLTLLVAAPEALAPEIPAGTSRVGVRVPAHAVARGLCRAANSVLTATSANLSGQPAADSADAVVAALGGRIDLLLDAGPTTGGPPSTIVDVDGDDLRLVRSGAIRWEEIQACRRE
jgi:L-threonylcarbamoyladenylate synthase